MESKTLDTILIGTAFLLICVNELHKYYSIKKEIKKYMGKEYKSVKMPYFIK